MQDQLPLFRFFCAQLGAPAGFKPLRDLLRNVRQGYGDAGHSFFHGALAAQAGVMLNAEKLADYDLRIKSYVARLNPGRTPKVQLLYFQWLAVLFSEWFLDRYFGDPGGLRRELNAWLNGDLTIAPGVHFGDEDLSKAAFFDRSLRGPVGQAPGRGAGVGWSWRWGRISKIDNCPALDVVQPSILPSHAVQSGT